MLRMGYYLDFYYYKMHSEIIFSTVIGGLPSLSGLTLEMFLFSFYPGTGKATFVKLEYVELSPSQCSYSSILYLLLLALSFHPLSLT